MRSNDGVRLPVESPYRVLQSKRCRHVLYCRPFPSTDLGWMDTILLGQFRKYHLLADRFKRNLRFEFWRVVLSLRHFGSSFSSVNPS